MSETKKKILEMLSQNKINTEEAYRLLNALEGDEGKRRNEGHDNTGHEGAGLGGSPVKTKAKYLRVNITPTTSWETEDNPRCRDRNRPEKVNVRVPMALIRAGIKMKSLIPPEAKDKVNSALKEKGIPFDIDNIKNEDIEELVEALGDTEIDMEGGHGEKIKIYVE
jgi:hypothetical protein